VNSKPQDQQKEKQQKNSNLIPLEPKVVVALKMHLDPVKIFQRNLKNQSSTYLVIEISKKESRQLKKWKLS
jgi:hypothetical protein